MTGWNMLFLSDKRFEADPAHDAQWNRGAYLTNVLAHCSACHTLRNALMAEDFSRNLGGAQLGAWYAPNITSDPVSGIGAWTDDELVSYLKTGRAPGKNQAAGPMAEAVQNSLQYLSGQRVALAYAPGSYAEKVVLPAAALALVPDDIDDCVAASLMMNGFTASHFATDFYPIQLGDIALVHAAAGGVGSLLAQIIESRGGTVIGRVSSESKAALAKAAGADHVIADREGNFLDAVMDMTGGDGVHVVYDGSGPTTFKASLDVLRYSGTFCWYGPVPGADATIELFRLPKSIKIGYASFANHIRTPELLRSHAAQLFSWVREGVLKVHNGGVYALADAAKAQADMWSRKTSGKLLLIP
ncbi:zinc-binding dehydrogenase [Burkholderia cepacia]|uniref:zinc-binding dehydrogenase n=1 Tax=Burkholderia cepacia TaxID=292 RepID=UPI001E36BE30|nr:zinc-binding dehydrogenase [Burkholderia cepacia]